MRTDGRGGPAHCTAIKLRAECRLADIVDAGQERGEIATDGRPKTVRSADSFSDLGLSRQRVGEARLIRDTYGEAVIRERIGAATASESALRLRHGGAERPANRRDGWGALLHNLARPRKVLQMQHLTRFVTAQR